MSVPPNASRGTFNASSRIKRRLLRLEDPVHIHFKTEWREGNPLFDWLGRWGYFPIYKLQLRKERESPFFHEYIAFSLKNVGYQGGYRYFRIDRRQCPNEDAPMDSIYTSEVESYDTIEQITSLEHSEYNASGCRAELEFITDVFPDTIINICWLIHQRPDTRVYTLQRYNCYFLAQTIILGTARGVISISYLRKYQGNQGDPQTRVSYTLIDTDRKS